MVGEVKVSSKFRSLSLGWRAFAVLCTLSALTIAILYTFHLRPFGFMLVDITYLYLLIAFFLSQCFLWLPATKGSSRQRVPWYDIVCIFLSMACPFYFVSNEYELLIRGWETGAPTGAFYFSIILWALVLESGRRSAGLSFAIIVGVASLYPLFAGDMPGVLWAPSANFYQLSSYHSFSEESIVGIPLRVFGRLFFGFMAFAIALQRLRAGVFFNELALSLVGKTRAGNAKVAIIASGLFSSISGAPIANVMTTGAFTIPAMKREGFPPHFAGAVEATASSGGALMPPVMGAVAFIMAEFLEIPYSHVCLAAAIPSVLYFVCLFAQIDSYGARIGLKPREIVVSIPPVWLTLARNLHIILSFLLLVLLLFLYRLDAQAAWIATGTAVVLAMFRKETRLSFKGFVLMLEDIGRILGDLMGVMGPVGMIIGSLIITGIAFSLPNVIVGVAGGNVFFVLILGAVASFVLGMGVTISACYIFLAIVLAPGLVQAGFNELAVHLFILYCGMMSYITPPVALSAFAAATIAGSDPMKTGFQSMKLGIAKYILPFVFVYNPALILQGTLLEAAHYAITCGLGLVIISGALEGYFWKLGILRMWARSVMFIAGMLVIVPGGTLELIGVILFISFFAFSYKMRGRPGFITRPVPGFHSRSSGEAI